MPGRVHRADEVRDAPVLGHVGVGAGDEDAVAARTWASDVQIFWPLTTHSSPSRTARVPRLARSRARARLAEQLAPDLLAREQRRTGSAPSAPRCRRTRMVGPGPADADRVVPAGDTPARRSSSSMISWWIGSASRPHGARPVRRHVARLGQLAGPMGVGCAGEPRPHREPAGIVVRRQLEVHAPDCRAAVPLAPGPRLPRRPTLLARPCSTRGTDMAGWNFAELWERDRGHASPTPRPRSRATGAPPGPSSTAGPTASPATCSTPAPQHQDKVALYLYNCPEYMETHVRAPSRPAWSRSTPTTATSTTSSSTCGTTPTPSPSSSTARFTERIERVRGPRCPRCGTGSGSTTAPGPCPDWADALRGPRPRPRPSGSSAPWGRSGDDLLMLYTGGTTGMPKGVMWRQDDLIRAVVAPSAARRCPSDPEASDGRRDRGASPSPACRGLPGVPAHARHRLVHRHHLPDRRRLGRHARRTATSTSIELLDTIERERVDSAHDRRRRLRQADPARRSTPSPDRWDLSSLRAHQLVGRDVERAGRSRACCATTRGMILIDAFCVVGGHRPGPVDVRRPAPRPKTAKFTLGPERRGHHRRRPRRRARLGRAAAASPCRASRPSATTRTRRSRRRRSSRSTASATRSPATTPTVEADGTHHAARPRLGVHQHRRREGLPRGGRGGAQAHPTVHDAVVVGVPDDKFGEAITAVVEPAARRRRSTSATLIAHVKDHARRTTRRPSACWRSTPSAGPPNGKVDYKRAASRYAAATTLGLPRRAVGRPRVRSVPAATRR